MLNNLSLLKGITLLLIIIRDLYWRLKEKTADSTKQKKQFGFKEDIQTHTIFAIWVLVSIQLLGVSILEYAHNPSLQYFGFTMALLGFVISMMSRSSLGANWTHMAEAQAKEKHELITTGIYKYIRHPIYAGTVLQYVGSQLVAESYLAIPFLLLGLLSSYYKGKKEESILVKEFGDEYKNYMKTSSMLIPGVI